MQRLKRVINFWEALAIDIGAIIGAGIFVISGLAAGIAGPSVIVSICIGAVIVLFTGLSFAAMASIYIKEGGGYEYAKMLLGNYAGFLSGFVWVVGGMIAGAAMAISFGSYFITIFGFGFSYILVAIALVIILGVINYIGIKNSADISLILTVIKLLVLLFFVAVGLFFIKGINYTPFVPNGLQSIFVGAAYIFFAYTGFARAAILGDEVKNPKKTIPKVIIVSIIASAIVYLLVMLVLVGMVNYSSIANSTAPLSEAIISATHNQTIGFIIGLGAMFATINVTLTMILGLSRMIFAMSRDRNMPSLFSKLNRYRSPGYAVIVTVAVMLFAMVVVSFKEIVAISNSAVLVSYAISNLAAFSLVKNRGKALSGTIYGSKYFMAVPVLGFLFCISMLFFLTKLSLLITIALLIVVSLYYKASKKKG